MKNLNNEIPNGTYTLEQWAILTNLTLEEIYEPDISKVHYENGKMYTENSITGELTYRD